METWERAGDHPQSYELEVTVGKPLDVLRFRQSSLAETREYATFLRRAAEALYRTSEEHHELSACPACGADANAATAACAIYGVAYSRCPCCGHAFVRSQPSSEALNRVFAESDEHAAVYTDRATIETRLTQVIEPKLAWMRDIYRRQHARDLGSVLDVGAGGGHFVATCRRAGLQAEGFEISAASRRFAKAAFNIELRDTNFLESRAASNGPDAVTFWGLLEYTPEPRRFLEAARRHLDADRGMLIVEVPRFDALGSAIQAACPDGVARHLDPTSHVNVFSDASLITSLVSTGFKPVAAWYFGMDAFELLVQIALFLNQDDLVERLAHVIAPLQASLDAARLCDDIVVAAVPHA